MSTKSAVTAAQQVLFQLSDLLDRLTIDEYTRSCSLLNGSSIGQHVRHSLEFFVCLFEGLNRGVVNYDARRRDIFLESNTLEAQNTLQAINTRLAKVSNNEDINMEQAYDDILLSLPSNLYRELVYNIEHAVHHMALIRVGLKEVAPELELSPEFGLANSTLKYRKSISKG